ncbi:MAG: hypothetical protein JRN70_02930 [Nitrososphaerota archaeon]|jgi:hypothetical protein|nr:hypothetical protein [Nitrososphaerota archaeon]
MPELWIPYGGVETLVTIQAENLGAVSEPLLGGGAVDMERFAELAKASASVFVCDSVPATIQALKGVIPLLGEAQGVSIYSPAPKRVEGSIPELKGKITTLPPPIPAGEGEDPVYSPELMSAGGKLFVGTARPDPLFGVIDTRVEACLGWVARSRAAAARSRREMEPTPLQKTAAYEVIEGVARGIPESKFMTVIPRGGKPWAILEDPPFDAVKNSFPKAPMQQGRGLVVGAGGQGYDDTFSSALRGVWNVIEGVRKSGSILLVAECSGGVGSTALEMLVTGRLADGERRKDRYTEGIEEVQYLSKLKEEYDVLLLSGLPETYARSKLGLATARGSGEAVGRLLNKVGRSGKINVVTRAGECQVELG